VERRIVTGSEKKVRHGTASQLYGQLKCLLLPARRSASAVLAVALCPSVCHNSQAGIVMDRAERIELVLVTGATLGLSYNVLEGNAGTFKNSGTSHWNFYNCTPSVHLCVQHDGCETKRRAGLSAAAETCSSQRHLENAE